MSPNPQHIINALLAYWNDKRADRPFPSRRDIDPVDIPYALQHAILLDVIASPKDFFCRLVGDHIQNNTRDIQGLHVSEIVKNVPDLSYILQLCEEITKSKKPLYGDFDFITSSRIKKRINYVGLPLYVSQPNNVEMILCAVIFAPL